MPIERWTPVKRQRKSYLKINNTNAIIDKSTYET